MNAEESFDEPENRRGGSPEEIAQSQALAQNVVNQQNDIQNLINNPQFSLTTENGDTLNYINGNLTSVQRLDGTTLNNIELNNGQIINTDIKLEDGSTLLFKNSKVSGYLTPDGRKVEYNEEGNIGIVTEKDGLVTTYYYDSNDKNILTYTDSNKFHMEFEANTKKIKSVLNKITGETSNFVNGRLRTIIKATGEIFGFSSSVARDGKETVRLSFYRDRQKQIHYFTWGPDGKIKIAPISKPKLIMGGMGVIAVSGISINPQTALALAMAIKSVGILSVTYGEHGRVLEVQKPGEKLIFKNGVLDQILDSQGKSKANVDYDPNSLFGTSIVQNNASSVYDKTTGRLSEVKVQDFTIHYKEGTDTIDYIIHTENKDGAELITKLTNLEFDDKGVIKKTTVLKDGEERTYSKTVTEVDAQGNKHEITTPELTLISVKKPDDTQFDYGKILDLIQPITLTTPDKFVYEFNYTNPSNIVANLKKDIDQSIPDLTAREMQFDTSFNLKKLIRENNEILSFQDNKLISIDNKEVRYNVDQSYSIVDGNSEMFYNAQGNPSNAVIKEEGKEDLNVTYEYGKIRKIYRGNNPKPVFEYSYSTDTDGKELTLIHDDEEKTLKKYKDRNLIEEFNEDTNVESFYTYYAESEAFPSKIKDVEVKRLGNVIQTYHYSYNLQNPNIEDDDLTIVTDDENIKRTYGQTGITLNKFKEKEIQIENTGSGTYTTELKSQSDAQSKSNKLITLERDGFIYSYKYHRDTTELANGQTQVGDEMVEEELSRKKLSGNAVAYYEAGNLVKIELNDGTNNYITGVAPGENGQAYKATLNIVSSGVKKVFSENQVLELILSTGEHYFYDNGLLSKVIDPILGEMAISYDEDAFHNIQTIWAEPKDSKLKLKYDPQGILKGLKLNAFMTPEEVQATAADSFTSFMQSTSPMQGGIDSGPNSRDGDFNTAQSVSWSTSFGQSQGGATVDVSSIINLEEPQTITQLKVRFTGYGRGWGAYSNNNHGDHKYEIYYQQGTNDWILFNGASGSNFSDTGILTLNVNVAGVTAIKAWCKGYGAGSDQGGAEAGASIYEFQFTSADQANYSFSSDANGYSFTGYAGVMRFDTNGQITEAASGLAVSANALKNKMQDFKTFSHTNKLNISTVEGQSGLFGLSKESVLDSDVVTVQEYSQSGILETQLKANKTVTVFENNKPFQVLDEKGTVLMEYFYDEVTGNTTRINLKNARDTLPDKIKEVENNIETERANALRQLAVDQGLVYQDIKDKAEADRKTVDGNLTALRDALNDFENTDVHGSKAKKQKSQQLDQIRDLIRQQEENQRLVNRIEADSYAQLATAVREYSDKIENESNKSLTELRTQEANIQKEILRQEISPIIYDSYRRIIGRDPSSQDYDYWISKVDYKTGLVKIGEETRTEIIPSIAASFDGAGDYLSVQDNDAWSMSSPTNYMTIDFNVKLNSLSSDQAFVSHGLGDDDKWQLYWLKSNNLKFYARKGGVQLAEIILFWAPKVNTWYHIALVKNGNYLTLYIDGKRKGSGYISFVNDTINPNSDLQMGHMQYLDGRDVYLNGKIDQFRISNIQRWTSNFTPATLPAQADANTTLLIQGSELSFLDQSTARHAVSTVGSVALDKDDYKLSKSVEGLYAITNTVSNAITDYFKNDLEASKELRDRETYVTTIKQNVETFLDQYLSAADKTSFLSGLGLTAQEVIPDKILLSDKQTIVTWLKSRSLHFGQSAFLALENLIEQKLNRPMISEERTELAKKAILIDILTGVITPLDKDDDLVISINALNRTAHLYNLEIAGAKLSWEDLKAIFQNDPNSKVIAHINGNHFVIVTAITEDSITYIDPGIGKDKENESLTVTKKGFLEGWKGYVTFEKQKIETLSLQDKKISAQKAMTIRGAFWGSILNLIGAILNIISFGAGVPLQLLAFAVSAAEGDWISAISSLVNASFASLGSGATAFKTAFDGFTNALGPLGSVMQGIATVVNGIGTMLTNAFQSVTGFFNGILGSFGSFLSSAGTMADLARTAVGIGVNIGISKGLEALGVSPELAGFLGSLTAGGIIGGMQPVDSAVSNVAAVQVKNIQAYIQQTITIVEVGRLGVQLGVDSALTNIIGLSLAAIQGAQILTPTGDEFAKAFKDIKSNLYSSLGQYGFDQLGVKLGIDSDIMHLIGTPIASAAGARIAGQSAVDAFNNGLGRGATSLAINYAIDQADLDPLLGSLTARTITGAIEGLFRIPELNPNFDETKPIDDITNPKFIYRSQNLFEGIYNAYRDSALNFSRLGISGNDAWANAQYLQRIQNFSDIVREPGGLPKAIEDSATQILREDTISAILKDFLSVRAYLEFQQQNNLVETVTIGESQFKKWNLPNGDYIMQDSLGNVIEIKRGSQVLKGTFAKSNTGEWGLRQGTITKYDGDIESIINIDNGREIKITVSDSDKELLALERRENEASINYDSEGNFYDVRLSSEYLAMDLNISRGDISSMLFNDVSSNQTIFEIRGNNIIFHSPNNSSNLPIITDADHLNPAYDSSQFDSFLDDLSLNSTNVDQWSLFEKNIFSESVLGLFEPNRNFESDNFGQAGSLFQERVDLIGKVLGGHVASKLFKAIQGAADNISQAGLQEQKELLDLLKPRDIEKSVSLYEHERVQLRNIYQELDNAFQEIDIISNVSFDRNIVTANEAKSNNSIYDNLGKLYSFTMGNAFRGIPLIGTAISYISEIISSDQVPYNSSQTEYKINLDYYTQSDNIKHNMVVYVRMGEYEYQGKVLVGPVQTSIIYNDYDPDDLQRLIPKRLVRVPGSIDEVNV